MLFRRRKPCGPTHGELIAYLHDFKEILMSTLADLTASVQQLTDAVTGISTAVGRLEEDFAALKASLPPAGTLTAEQQAALDAAVSSVDASIAALVASTASVEVDSADPAPAGSAAA